MIRSAIMAEIHVYYAIKFVLFLHALQGTDITLQELCLFVLAHPPLRGV